jgi:hypothetical protein
MFGVPIPDHTYVSIPNALYRAITELGDEPYQLNRPQLDDPDDVEAWLRLNGWKDYGLQAREKAASRLLFIAWYFRACRLSRGGQP